MKSFAFPNHFPKKFPFIDRKMWEKPKMDNTEQMAADIALAMNGGEWKDGKWYSKGHREAWIKAVKPYADEIERLREELKAMRENKWKPLVRVHPSDCPTDEYRGVPVCMSGNRIWPWPDDNVVLYAALKGDE